MAYSFQVGLEPEYHFHLKRFRLAQDFVEACIVPGHIVTNLAISLIFLYSHHELRVFGTFYQGRLTMEQSEEERRRHRAESARKQLADGTWPQVMMVFAYMNPKAPRIPGEEFDRLTAFYEQAACANMVQFIELLRSAETERDVTMSFNFSMRRRLVPGDAPEATPENARLLFSCPDILVGTRTGTEGAAVWLKNFSEAMPSLVPESVQVIDKIFGEAIPFLKGSYRPVTLEELFRSAILGEDGAVEPLEVSEP